MPELKPGLEESRSRIDTMAIWLPRIAVAVAFIVIGASKFETNSLWVRLFAQIGLGEWFRYLTGALQIVGAVMVLVPRACLAGIALLGCTMCGAIVVWIVVLRAPGNAVIPAVVLGGLAAVGVQNLGRRSNSRPPG